MVESMSAVFGIHPTIEQKYRYPSNLPGSAKMIYLLRSVKYLPALCCGS
jgi:hypothetical protein